MTDIAITGACGKMGRVIAELVKERDDCRVSAGIDIRGEKAFISPRYFSCI